MERVRKPHHGDGGTEGVRMGRGSVGLVRVNGRPDWIERGSSHLAADHPHHHLITKYKQKYKIQIEIQTHIQIQIHTGFKGVHHTSSSSV